ncbi:MAG: response regulator [Verrucomicrobia bacterium]|nr:response regulator [Verrucomicrobiota bacterium]
MSLDRAQPATERDSPDPAGKVNILLVDDRPDKLLAMQVLLSELHENVVSVPSGKEALRRLLREDFAVILLDVNMPGMDGFETAALIRSRSRSEATPIIFVSEIDPADNHVARGYSLGAVDYIQSPVVPEILRAKVAVFVELYRKTEMVRRQAAEHARFLQEQTARALAEAEMQRMTFLAEASDTLSTSLDQRQIFESLARLLVPRVGDLCLVDVLAGKGGLHQVAVAHSDPVVEESLRGLQCFAEENCAVQVLRTARPVFCDALTPDLLDSHFPQPECCEIVRGLQPTAYLAVPIFARQQLVGAISLLGTGGRVFETRTLALAESLAQRAAVALDNARLYRRAQDARLEAERANRAKDDFLAMLSHELRTPLTPVLATVLGLTEQEETPASLRPHLELIRRNVELETRLIDDLLDLTSISRGKLQLRLEVTDVHEILAAALAICRPDFEARALQVTCALQATRTLVAGDAARLQQVFWNVLKNAVKFTPPGGRISVSSWDSAPNGLIVEIRDSGFGILPEQLAKIFDAFEQVDRKNFGGLGLGLAISRSLVQLHRGEITAHSEGQGTGATFRIVLPTTDAPAQASTGQLVDVPVSAADGLRVLLVEDNADTNASLTWLLRRRGFDVISAHNVGTALALIDAHGLDVLISDLGLPDGSGLQVLAYALGKQPRLHAIALSGYGMAEDMQKSRDAGFRHHLVKPVDVQKLEEAIQLRDAVPVRHAAGAESAAQS